MKNTSTVAGLAQKAGKWAVLGAVFTMFSVGASSCATDEENGNDGNGSSDAGASNEGEGGSGNGGDEGDGGAAGAGESGSDSDSFLKACGDEISDEKLLDCGSTGEEAKQLKVNMLVVLDKSGSMDLVPSGYSATLWESVKGALSEVLDDSQSRINYALELYPFPEDPNEPIELDCETNCCEMPSDNDMNVPFDEDVTAVTASDAPEGTAVERILDVLDATEPGGGTPTAAALRRAREYLQAADLDGDTYVLLATDGGPNCNAEASCSREDCTMHIDGSCVDEQRPTVNCCEPVPEGCVDADETREAIEALADAGVPTYVVGIPGSEPYEASLNEFAVAGGVPNEDGGDGAPSFYQVSASGGSAALARTFRRITEQLVTSCDIPLAEAPPDTQRVNVAINCLLLPRTDADGEDQWEFRNDNTTIRILGDTCADIEDRGAKRVDILLGCPPIGIF